MQFDLHCHDFCLPQVIRSAAVAALKAYAALAVSKAGTQSLGTESGGLSGEEAGALLKLLASEASSLERDPVGLINTLKSALQSPNSKRKQDSEAKKGGGLAATSLGAFLLSQLASCMGKGKPGPQLGLMVLDTVRDWAAPGPLLDAGQACLEALAVRNLHDVQLALVCKWHGMFRVRCLCNLQAASFECPEEMVPSQLQLGLQLLGLCTVDAVDAAGEPKAVLHRLQAFAAPQALPPSFAPLRAAALSCWTPGLFQNLQDLSQDGSTEMLLKLMHAASRDPNVECQQAARRTLDALPLSDEDLRPLLATQKVKPNKRARGSAGENRVSRMHLSLRHLRAAEGH